ncbi:hypothetical protein V8C26DRAFT_277616 [Trichoderma gracile]
MAWQRHTLDEMLMSLMGPRRGNWQTPPSSICRSQNKSCRLPSLPLPTLFYLPLSFTSTLSLSRSFSWLVVHPPERKAPLRYQTNISSRICHIQRMISAARAQLGRKHDLRREGKTRILEQMPERFDAIGAGRQSSLSLRLVTPSGLQLSSLGILSAEWLLTGDAPGNGRHWLRYRARLLSTSPLPQFRNSLQRCSSRCREKHNATLSPAASIRLLPMTATCSNTPCRVQGPQPDTRAPSGRKWPVLWA